MSYKIKVTFPAGVTEETIANAIAEAGGDPDAMNPGMLTREVGIENGLLVFTEEWESKAVFEAFITDMAPVVEQTGLPMPTIEEL